MAVTGTEADISMTLGASSVVFDTSDIADQSPSGGVNNLSLYHMDPLNIYNAHRDTAGQLKAAFIFHVKAKLVKIIYYLFIIFIDMFCHITY